jgi:hypothetical protein
MIMRRAAKSNFVVNYITAFIGWMAVSNGGARVGQNYFWWGLLLLASLAISIQLIRERRAT